MSLQSRYTILRKIADGGTAEIFLAKQHGAQGFEKTVVLKRIFTAFYSDPQFRHMLVDEAHVAMSLNHSNIVQVLDLGESEGRYFLALELVDGWTLDKILRRAKAAGVPFPPALALYVTAEVCRALAYAHGKRRDGKSMDIVHRDISPHNVLLSVEGEVKLTDFGIAKAQNKKEQSLGNLIKGKIAFMSPEQASGGDIDARSDLFSAGTMLYAMITRRLPFDAPTDYETLLLVKSGDFLPPETARPGLNPELYRVMRKAMGKSPSDRYQKADEMLVDVEQVMRLAFRPVGQTELQRWLADLTAKDGVPALTREAPGAAAGQTSTVGPLAAAAGAHRQAAQEARGAPPSEPAQESGLVLDMADAVEVSASIGAAGPPPPPMAAATEVMLSPPSFTWAEPWYRRRGARIGGGVVLLLLLVLSASALVRSGRRAGEAQPSDKLVATPEPTPAPPAPTPEPAAVPAPQPAPQAPPVAATADAAAQAVAQPAPPPAPAAPAQPPPAHDEVAAAEKAAAEPAPPAAEEPGADAPERETTKSAPAPAVSVAIKSDPEGSKVSTRSRSYGTTPLSLKLRPGTTYQLNFTKTGYSPVSKRYTVSAKEAQTVRVTLRKLPEATPRTASKSSPAKAASSSRKVASPAESHAAPAAQDKKKQPWWKFGR